jgi:hypothetical protein
MTGFRHCQAGNQHDVAKVLKGFWGVLVFLGHHSRQVKGGPGVCKGVAR